MGMAPSWHGTSSALRLHVAATPSVAVSTILGVVADLPLPNGRTFATALAAS
jgi:hypothetical protein